MRLPASRRSLALAATLGLLYACPPPDTGETDDPDVPCAEVDADGDGYDACVDCDDERAGVHPDADERCNGRDDDCDGELLPDEEDADGDGEPDCRACAEAGYWELTRGITDRRDLESVLHDASEGLTDCNYTSVTTYMFTRLDVGDGAMVECVYTGRKTSVASGDKPDSDDMNTEHTWPRSWGADAPPELCDLHHLFPTDADANSERGNMPFGEVVSGTWWSQGGSSAGRDSSGREVFEPRDVHKGNVARAMLYYAMRYDESLSSADLALYGRWHALDPVDARERERSLQIGEYQEHANPYVVCPGLAEISTGS